MIEGELSRFAQTDGGNCLGLLKLMGGELSRFSQTDGRGIV